LAETRLGDVALHPDDWYEWQEIDAKHKRPYHFQPKGEPFAFGAVYDVWKRGSKTITSFSIVIAGRAVVRAVLRPLAAGAW